MNPSNYPALAAELLAGHPVSGAYDPDPQLAADQINALDTVVDKEHLPSALIFDAIINNKGEWDAMTADDREWVRNVLDFNSAAGVPTATGTPARTTLVAILGTATKAELAAQIAETVSRATELGFGFVITDDVQNARNL